MTIDNGPDSWSTEMIRLLMSERDRRVDERINALEQLMTAAIQSQKEAVAIAMAAADRAVNKAEGAAERRFESINEFRAALADQAGHFMTRSEMDARLSGVSDRLNLNANRIERIDGRTQGVSAAMAAGIAIVSILVAVSAVFVQLAAH